MALDLKQVKLEALSDIRYSFWIGEHPGQKYSRDVLVIRFEGTFGFGSGGNDDATFMCSIGKAALEAFSPEAIIIDLSGLSYEWGDQMECVFGIGENLPSALVVGPQCREAIGTLCFGETSTKDACEEEWIFDSLDAAWTFVARRLDDGENPPIHEAAETGDIQRVKLLLDAGENPNRLDSLSRTPLHRASKPEIVKLLLGAGADVNAKDSASLTALHFVTNIECAQLLLAAAADPDARSWSELSPLGHVQSVEIARLLIAAGADVHLRRRTSLLHGVRNSEIARLFIEFGANVNALDEHGRTPLDVFEEARQIFQREVEQYGNGSQRVSQDAEMCSILRARGGRTSAEIKLHKEQ